MVRALALISLAAGFLIISPKLRLTAWDGITVVVNHLEQYSPYSYVALAVALLLCFMFLLKSTAAPRRSR
jgi:hypothetical protein